ncbi:MAG: helix-turn-helix domain-containing protein [Bacteroidia bacterium]|nr:helix-turn-helix domain-containing protein [Bacteroidia bacterium]
MEEINTQLQELKQLVLIGAKNAFNIEEAAMLMGYSVSHLRKLVASNAIPYYKSTGGKFIYFKKSELENWMLAYRVNTSQEAEQAAAKILEGRP